MKTTKSGKVILNYRQEKVFEVREAKRAVNEANKQIRQWRPYGLARILVVFFITLFMYFLVFCAGVVVGDGRRETKKVVYVKYTQLCTLPDTGGDIR